MKAWLFVIGLAFAFSLRANADPFPIIDVRSGYLIGAVNSGNWLEPTDATVSVKSGAKLRVYGMRGDVGAAQVLKIDMQYEPCPDRPVVKPRPPKVAKGAVAFAASWNPLPRKSKSVDPKQQQQHVGVVGEFLRARGFREPIVHISQIVRVDLDGDGQDEFVVSATHYKNGDEIPDESSANTYSFVIIERVVDGKTKTKLVDGEFYPEARADSARNKFEIAALLDLNGDGKIDIVVRSAYYEGDEITVYEYQPSGVKKVLSVGCGL